MSTRLRLILVTSVLPGLLGAPVSGQSQPRAGRGAAKQLTLKDLFPRKRVLDVRITVDEDDWNTIRRQSRNLWGALNAKRKYAPIPGPYTYVKAKVTIDGVEFPEVGLRKKGFIGSQSTTRPSLKIKLNHVDKQAGIEGLTNLTFNNNRQDAAQVSQVLGYALFNAVGSPAPRCSFAKITVNGENLGIYSHVESMKRQLFEHRFGNSKGTLYEGTVVDFFEGWEGSFEKKFGPDGPGREKIAELTRVLGGGGGEALLDGQAEGRGLVPTDGKQGRRWTAIKFDDASWKRGRNGAGFDTGRTYAALISEGFDFKEAMHKKSASVYLRFPFTIDKLSEARAGHLVLRMKYDDGFVAYLNGKQVAAANAPDKPRWDSTATLRHADPEAVKYKSFDISAHKSKLRRGKNVLAIHGLNDRASSADMLIVAELQRRDSDLLQAIGEVVDLDAFYKFWAVEGILGFWDGYSGNSNNFFVYLNPTTDKFHFLPWGADALFMKFSPLVRNTGMPLSVKTKGLVAHQLYQIPSQRKRYLKTLQGILKKHWKEKALLAEIDRIEKMLKPHLSPRQGRFSRALDKVRVFIRNRRKELRREIQFGMPEWNKPPDPPFAFGADPGPPGESRSDAKDQTDTAWAAAVRGDVPALTTFLSQGTDVNAVNEKGDGLLSLAAVAGRNDAVKFLLGKGAKIDAKNKDGSVPLHGAAFLGHVETVKTLLAKGADASLKNARGETSLDIAAAPFNDLIKGFVNFIGGLLGLKLDPEQVKADRLVVAGVLREHLAKDKRQK